MASSTSSSPQTFNYIQALIPIFNGGTYDFWNTQMRTLFISQDLWDVVENSQKELASWTQTKQNEYKQLKQHDAKALIFIQQGVSGISRKIFSRIMQAKNAKEAWKILNNEFKSTDKATIANNFELKRFVDSTITMLGCVDNKKIQACSISIVPDHLRESNKDSYIPKVVSIGPLHRRTKRSLLYMEETKWRCMVFLLHRTNDPKDNLKRCCQAMYYLDEAFRASYLDDLKSFDTNDLAKIMLLDGCFLLELLISNNKKLDTKFKYISPKSSVLAPKSEDIGPSHRIEVTKNELSTELECLAPKSPVTKLKHEVRHSPGIEAAKKEVVLSDLILFENQIPLLVVNTLSIILFPEEFEKETSYKRVNELVLCLYGYSPCPNVNTDYKDSHLLELLHYFVTGELRERVTHDESEAQKSNDGELKLTIIGENDKQLEQKKVGKSKSHGNMKSMPCAAKLDAAGVTINFRAITNHRVGFDFYMEVKGDRLVIPQLYITGTTEAKWRNFIAWEHNKKDREQFDTSGPKEGKFSCYALLFRNLICCVHDIQFLKEKGAIVVHDEARNNEINQDKKKKKKMMMSNNDLMLLIKNIAEGVGDGEKVEMESSFNQLFQELKKKKPSCVKNLFVIWHSIRCFLTFLGKKCRKSLKVFRLEYTPTVWKTIGLLSGVTLLLLSIAQVVLKVVTM